MPFARIGADGTFTALELQETFDIDQIRNGFSGTLSGNTATFNNKIKIIFDRTYSLEAFFPCKLIAEHEDLSIALELDSNNNIICRSVGIGSNILSSYKINEVYCSAKIWFTIETPYDSADFKLLAYTSSDPAYNYKINANRPVSGVNITIQELVDNAGVSIGSNNTKCLRLIESSEQIPDYYAWINHIKIGDSGSEQLTKRDQILFFKNFLDSNDYTDGTVISLQDDKDNSISFVRQGDVFNNIEVNISNLDTSDFYINYVLFPHKESHIDQFYLYGGYTASRAFTPEVTLSQRLYTYIKTENDNDIYGISGTSMIVLKAAWVLRPIYLSIVSGANILCSQLVESRNQIYQVYEPKIVDYNISDGSDGVEINYVKIGINNLTITLFFDTQTDWINWKYCFSTSNSRRESEVVFCIKIPTKGSPVITKGQRFSDWESTSDIQIKGIIGTSETDHSLSIRTEKNNIVHEYDNIVKNSDYIYDISSNPINIEQDDRWYRSLPTID